MANEIKEKTLYLVATPIGNMGDITLRALDALRGVDVIFCEDTRHSMPLLSAYGIRKPLESLHKFNETAASEKVTALLAEGRSVAYISDAGMPCISDPGAVVAEECRKKGFDVTVIPGANAALCALVLSGFSCEQFAFLGFLPSKKTKRRELLEQYRSLRATLIVYSAPHDVENDVKDLFAALGDRRVSAVKEITKLFERAERSTLGDFHVENAKGEFVLVIEGATQTENSELVGLSAEEHLRRYIDNGMDEKEAIKRVAKERGVPKNQIYMLINK